MTTTYSKPWIELSAGEAPFSENELIVELTTAPDKPGLGLAGINVGEVLFLPVDKTPGKILVSLGKAEKLTSEKFRQAGGELAKWLLKNHVNWAAIQNESFSTWMISDAFEAFLEGLLLGSFRFDRHKKNDKPEMVHFTVRTAQPLDTITKLVIRTQEIASAVFLAREWSQEPANVINPVSLAERAVEFAQQHQLKCTILDDVALTELGAGAILSVGKGSQTPSRMIVLEYPGKNNEKPVVFVGKAITFDTGGYSIKDTTNIQHMKYDKSGGMVVFGVLQAAAKLNLDTPIVGIICAAENMISDHAYRPDDIITSLSGKTIEIITTDAEGRLVLADGITYAQQKYQPRAIIDIATLTGGVLVALGRVRAGLFSNNDLLAEQLKSAGELSAERVWQLPLDEEYFQYIKGDDADLKNSGGREGHPIMGGIFLKQFIENDIPWAHLDIAGMADSTKDLPYAPKGATGFGVRLLLKYLENLD